jgi:hypothetical protein
MRVCVANSKTYKNNAAANPVTAADSSETASSLKYFTMVSWFNINGKKIKKPLRALILD